jgi:hypothetical protein
MNSDAEFQVQLMWKSRWGVAKIIYVRSTSFSFTLILSVALIMVNSSGIGISAWWSSGE